MSSYKLPSDLLEAEHLILKSLLASNLDSTAKRLSIDLRFEGLRLSPVVFRLSRALTSKGINNILIWADAGATALAKRDADDLRDNIYSFKEINTKLTEIDTNILLLIITPQPYDYEEFEQLSNSFQGDVVMFNGRLQDFAVGVGSVGRERSKGFASSWQVSFWLQPLQRGALMKVFPEEWSLFKAYSHGYKFLKQYSIKPDSETIFLELTSD